MLRLQRVEVITIILFILIIAGVIALTAPFHTLRSINIPWALISVILFSTSLSVWTSVWVFFLRRACLLPQKEIREVPDSHTMPGISKEGPPSNVQAFALSMASLSGLLTPMNIGTDILRSLFGRRYLGVPLSLTATASVLTRIYKLQVTLFLTIFAAVLFARAQKFYLNALIAAAAGSVLLLILLYSMTMNCARRISQRLKIGDLAAPIKVVKGKLNLTKRSFIYLMMILQFVLEWLALHACFLALKLRIPLITSFILYVLLYILSRTPFVPQGLGVVEAGGYAVLKTMKVSAAQIGALLVVWGFLRIFIPLVLSMTFSIELMAMTRKRKSVGCRQANASS